MENIILLCDSNLCRLCGESNNHKINIFTINENSTNLQELINKYLPIVIEEDEKFPKYICPGCHIQLESTKLFLDLIVEGQSKLRTLYKKQQQLLLKEINIEIDASVNSSLYEANHALKLQTEGLDRPKRKRGRPAKKSVPEDKQENVTIDENKKDEAEIEEIGPDGRRKRRIRAPARFQGIVQGKELEDILKKEGVIDEDMKTLGVAEIVTKKEDIKIPTSREIVIGRTEGEDGEDLGKPIFINRAKIKPKTMILKRIEIGSFECDICSKKFINKIHFNEHLKAHENEDLNTNSIKRNDSCIQNSNNSSSSIEVSKDTLKLSSAENVNADIMAGTISVINFGLKDINDDNICTKCNKTFTSPEALKIHADDHNDSKKFTCEICFKVLQHPSSLLYHKQTEHNNKRFICNTCNRSFKHRQLLQRHQIVHSEDRPFVCPICKASFKTQGNLMNHEAVHTGEKKFECTECDQKFAHKTSLSLHQRWHEGKKPYTCEFCQKSFSQNGNLLEHKRIHTGEKPFFCQVCGKRFTTSSQLKIHIKRHTGEKPWKCQICDRGFLHKDSYKFHVRRHLNEKPYACESCTKTFTEPWALKKHKRTHTGEKPFSCEICNKTFSDKSNRDKHIRIHGKFQKCNITISTDNVYLPTILNKDQMKEDDSSRLQLTQLVDQQGNPISITTQDGQTVPIVTSGDDDSNLQGLMPDGTLVPIQIAAVQEKDFEEEVPQEVTLDLLETPSSDSITIREVLENKQIVQSINPNFQLLTNNDGEEVCLVTYSIKDDAVTEELILESALAKN